MVKRIDELDSLRGLAAFCVFINHAMIMLPMFPDTLIGSSPLYVRILTNTPLHFFWAGVPAVYLFFLLSGFVLSIPFFSTSVQYVPFVTKRFFRLYIPYLSAVFLAVILDVCLSSGGIKSLSGWFNEMWSSPITVKLLLGHVLMIDNFNVNAFDSPIWSLVQEMRISLVFPLLAYFVVRFGLKINLLISVVLSVAPFEIDKLLHNTQVNAYSFTLMYASMFVVGALMAKYRKNIIQKYSTIPTLSKYVVMLLGITLFTYKWFLPNVSILHNPELSNWCIVLGAASFIVICLSSATASRVLRFYPIWLLGKISYSFYLLHALVLYSFTYLLYTKVPLWVIWLLTLAVSYLLSVLSYYYIEQPSIGWGKQVASKVGSQKKTPVAEFIN